MKKWTIVTIVIDVLVVACFIMFYAVPSFKNNIIATALNTKTHQWIAYTFYSEETVAVVSQAGSYTPLTDKVDTDAIVIDTSPKSSYDNEYDAEILTRDADAKYKK